MIPIRYAMYLSCLTPYSGYQDSEITLKSLICAHSRVNIEVRELSCSARIFFSQSHYILSFWLISILGNSMVYFHSGGRSRWRRYHDHERGDNSIHVMYTHTGKIANLELYRFNDLLRHGFSTFLLLWYRTNLMTSCDYKNKNINGTILNFLWVR